MTATRTPSVRMGNPVNGIWAVADRVIAVKIGIVVAAAAVVVIAVSVWIVAPARVSGRYKQGGGKRTAAIAVTVTVVAPGGRIVWVIGA
jgi:hypothetical protein